MAKVQKPLPGLAKFLGIETQGILRLDAGNQVVPVLDIDNYLGPNKFQLTRVNIAATGDEALFTVPDNRFWRAKWIGCYYAPPAGTSMLTRVLYRPIIGATSIAKFYLDRVIGDAFSADSPAAVQSGHGMSLEGFDLQPGDQIGYEVSNKVGAGNWNLDAYLLYQELEF